MTWSYLILSKDAARPKLGGHELGCDCGITLTMLTLLTVCSRTCCFYTGVTQRSAPLCLWSCHQRAHNCTCIDTLRGCIMCMSFTTIGVKICINKRLTNVSRCFFILNLTEQNIYRLNSCIFKAKNYTNLQIFYTKYPISGGQGDTIVYSCLW